MSNEATNDLHLAYKKFTELPVSVDAGADGDQLIVYQAATNSLVRKAYVEGGGTATSTTIVTTAIEATPLDPDFDINYINAQGIADVTLGAPSTSQIGKLFAVEVTTFADVTSLTATNINTGDPTDTTITFTANGASILLYGLGTKWLLLKAGNNVTVA